MHSVISTQSSRRIQILRALAILAVVGIHTCASGPLGVKVRPFFNSAVALFLGLSGYLTYVDVPAAKVKKRLLRVLIPYLIWSLVYTAYRHTWHKLLIHLLTGYSCGVFYFIVVYMQMTLLAPLIGRLIRSPLMPIGFLITPAAIIVQYHLEFAGAELDAPYNEVFFPVWFTFFFLGMLLRWYEDRGGLEIIHSESGRRMVRDVLIALVPATIYLQIVEGFWWRDMGYGRMQYTQIKLSAFLTSCLIILAAAEWIEGPDRGLSLRAWPARVMEFFSAKGLFDVSDRQIRSLLARRFLFSRRLSDAVIYIGDISFGIFFTHMIFVDLIENSTDQVIRDLFPYSWFLIFAASAAFITLIRRFCGRRISRTLGLM